MFCKECGSEVKEGNKFCRNCGTPTVYYKTQMTPAANSETETVTPAAPAAQTTPEAPATPVAPAAQTAPAAPAAQTAPAAPTTPAAQTAPAAPVAQTAPAAPTTPAAQTASAAPAPSAQPAKKKSGAWKWLLGIPAVLAGVAACIFLGIQIREMLDTDRVKSFGKHTETDSEPEADVKTPKPAEKPKGEVQAVATPEPTPEPPAEPELDSRTVMIYMIGSNLESESGLASKDIDEMLKADSSASMNIVLQTGGTKSWTNPEIADGKVQRFTIENKTLKKQQDLGAVSMVEKSTLTDFICYAKDNYPAKEYVLVLWNHGGSVPIGFGSDDLFQGELTDVEIGQAVADSGIHVDALIFNACEMCSLELFMALKENVDYVVAAESVVYGYGLYGSGIDYTSWLNLAVREEISIQDFCERILDDYVDFLDSIGSKGSMSVIRLDQIGEVYEAYRDYIEAVYYDMLNGGYASYIQARGDSGVYEGTDVVDISTLATKYENDYSTALRNAVTNAVVRTKSDLPYGHGITVYSPYQYPQFYDIARNSFETLDYDDIIIDFYDLLSSKLLYYNDQVNYAGDWYVAQTEESNYGHGNEYALDFTDMGDYYAIALTDEDWSIVKDVIMYVAQDLETLQIRYLYGSDEQYRLDDNDYIIAAPPQYWLFINNYIPTSYCEFRTEDENGWYQVYLVYAYVNGEEAYIRVDCSQDDINGTVKGYYLADFATFEYDEGHLFDEDDIVQLAALAYYEGEQKIYHVGEECLGQELYSEFQRLEYGEEEEVLIYYEITDVYDNVYSTDVITVSQY